MTGPHECYSCGCSGDCSPVGHLLRRVGLEPAALVPNKWHRKIALANPTRPDPMYLSRSREDRAAGWDDWTGVVAWDDPRCPF